VLVPSREPAWPGVVTNGQPFVYASHTFIPSGPKWVRDSIGSTLLSKDKTYLALISWDGRWDFGNPFAMIEWLRRDGRYFVDLYHVPSGRKLGLIQGTFHDVPPDGFTDSSFWIDGPKFVLPLDTRMRRLMVCEFTK